MTGRSIRRALLAGCALALAVALPTTGGGLLDAGAASGERTATDAVSTATAAATTAKTYELYRHDHSSTPTPWLACKAIGYRINTAHMPTGMKAVVESVMTATGKQVGVTFHYLGTTTRVFGSTSHSKTTPTIYVAFTSSTKPSGTATTFGWPGTIGIGGPGAGWMTSSKGEFDSILYGDVLLYTGFTAPKTGAGVTWASLIRHEVGHALDLAHRTSKTAVMYPTLTASAPAKFTTAEVTALKRVFQKTKCDYTSFGEMP